jgi:cation:H+ antiporter
MIAVAITCLPISLTGHRISRWEGAFLLTYYVLLTAYHVLDAMKHEAMPTYLTIMKLFAVPVAAVTLSVISLRAYRERLQRSGS